MIAIYDTHANHPEPRSDQTLPLLVRCSHIGDLLKRLRAAKSTCTFVLAGPDEA